ncbi:VanZ family protein [Streptomyces platensis]|uniref:VanZ family protein n=1 Tax=Streptomyces platensis TaxID=58346 RepID=A0AAE6NH06_STRPT|nr:VanZ family protein [Streptomyces platensis]OSY37500.1 VanZ like family protein [Streptomyces platensis]QEV52869.1 VanZ family protein [Streptomyces platensis]
MWQVVLGVTPTTAALCLVLALAAAVALALWTALVPDSGTPRTTARALLAGWLLLFLLATLAPSQPVGSGDATVWWRPGEGLFDLGAQLEPGELAMLVRRQIANAALFVPAPLLLRFAAPRASAAGAFLLGVGLCLVIETAQLLMRAGRIADIDDVICAAAGTVIGTGLALAAQLGVAAMRRRGLPRRAVRAAP